MKAKALLLATSLFLFSPFTLAKDMNSRLGVGISNGYAFSLPSVAIQYYPNSNLGFIGALGVDTEQNNSKFAISGGIRRLIFQEANMNFFMQGNLAMESDEISGTTNSGFELDALLGGEFFLPGLENLGFNFAGGAAVSNVNKVRFRTVGEDFLHGGIIFYF